LCGVLSGAASGSPTQQRMLSRPKACSDLKRRDGVPSPRSFAPAVYGLCIRSGSGARHTTALAEATDPAVDPDRRAWHRAQAASRPRRGRPRRSWSYLPGRAQGRGRFRGGCWIHGTVDRIDARPGAAGAERGARRRRGQAPGRWPSIAALGPCRYGRSGGPWTSSSRAQLEVLRAQIFVRRSEPGGATLRPLLLKGGPSASRAST